jgi:ABC-type antimicrobial peptide transport system permease subunit
VDLTSPPDPRAYDLLGEHWTTTMYVVTRGVVDAVAASRDIRSAVRDLDPSAPVFDVRTLDSLLADQTAPRWAASAMAAGTALLTLLLAAVGVYGLLAGSVAARAREMGIRRALGCPEGTLLTLVLREGAALVALGATAGLTLAIASARWLQSQLYGVTATDPRVLAEAAALLISIGLAAAFVPARRAARVDPTIALRVE